MPRDRFELHAGFVQTLNLTFGRKNDPVVRALNMTPEPIIFPKLRSLSLTLEVDDSEAIFNLVQSFSPTLPHLPSIYVQFYRSTFEEPSAMVANLLKSSTGQLKSLSFHMGSNMPIEVAGIIAQTMGTNPGLRRVAVTDKGPTYQALFEAASHLPQLEHASFYSTGVRESDPVVSTVPGYPCLRNFKGDIASRSIPSLLESLSNLTLEELKLYCSCVGSEPNLRNGLQRIGEFKVLKTFDLYIEAPDPAWSGILLPLTSCPSIQTLILRTLRVFPDVGNAEVKTMARAWPRLQHIHLGQIQDFAMTDKPSATLLGLESLHQFCPKLETIKMGVDASDLPDDFRTGPIGLTVKEVDLSGSVALGDVDRIADCICYLWPNLVWESSGRYGHRNDRSWHRVWVKVKERLGRSVSDREEDGSVWS